MLEPNDMKELKALAAQLADIRAQVKAQGGFVGDRDLHQCPACGLMEDVLYGGKLVQIAVCHKAALGFDLGADVGQLRGQGFQFVHVVGV